MRAAFDDTELNPERSRSRGASSERSRSRGGPQLPELSVESSASFEDATIPTTLEAQLIHDLGCTCTYWHILGKQPRHRRIPLATAALATTCVAVYYLHPDHGLAYAPGDTNWHLPFVAAVSHTNESHLWMNVIMLCILGWFLECTEGHLLVLCVAWAGALVAAGMHGALKYWGDAPQTAVRGFSGADYAIMWSQLALLALNWREMPLRWGRLAACLALLTADVIAYHVDGPRGVSYESHLFGALAGVSVSLAFGHNVVWMRWEVALVWLGLLGYVTLCAVSLAGLQLAAGGLAALLVPAFLVRAILITRRECAADARREPAHAAAGGRGLDSGDGTPVSKVSQEL